ncbi:MAG: RNA polymerase sigma-70 factor [Ferruginibacter sp.]
MNFFKPYDEQELLSQLRAGSKDAFTQLYHRYSEQLYYNILALVKDELVAEELLQDIFVRLWRKKESIIVEKNLGGYLFMISRNRVYDFFKNLDREQELYKKIRSTATEVYTHIEEALLSKENAGLLQKAIDTLPTKRKQAYQLCKMEGYSYKEASEEMGISISTLKDHMAKAREAIREYLSNNAEMIVGIFLFMLWNKK